MRRIVKNNVDGSKEVLRVIVGQAQGLEIRLLTDCGAKKGDKIRLTQYPDGSGKWEKEE